MKTFKTLRECLSALDERENIEYAHAEDGPYYKTTVKNLLDNAERFPAFMSMDAITYNEDKAGTITTIIVDSNNPSKYEDAIYPRVLHYVDARVGVLIFASEVIGAKMDW